MAVHEANAVVIYGHDVIGGTHVFPDSGTAVTNGGTGGATYNGAETTNHYTVWGIWTGQMNTASNETITVGAGASVNTLAAITLEWLFKWNSGTIDTAYFFGKGPNFYIKYAKATDTLTLYRDTIHVSTPAGTYYEQWHCHPGPFTNGSIYDLQISWGDVDSTPLVKCDNVSKSMTHDHAHPTILTWTWYPDDSYQAKVLNSSSVNAAVRCTLGIFRLHDTNLSSADLSDNYTADLRSAIHWDQSTPPNATATVLTHVITVVNDTRRVMTLPTSVTATVMPTVISSEAVITTPLPTVTATVVMPTITTAPLPNVPPPKQYNLTYTIKRYFRFTPNVEEIE